MGDRIIHTYVFSSGTSSWSFLRLFLFHWKSNQLALTLDRRSRYRSAFGFPAFEGFAIDQADMCEILKGTALLTLASTAFSTSSKHIFAYGNEREG